MKLAAKNHLKTNNYSQLSATELRTLLLQKEAELEAKNASIEEKNSIIEHVHATLAQVTADRDKYQAITEELLRLARVKRFAASSEKNTYQIDLFDEAELDVAIEDCLKQLPESKADAAAGSHANSNQPKPRQRGFSASLNRIRRELRLTDEERAGADKTFFTKVKEELEYIPAQLNVIEIWQEKAVFEQCLSAPLVIAKRPTHPLGKCMASTSLLAHIIVSKYADGLPLYRLDGMMKRLGHEIGRSNMANWIIRLENVLQPLINLMREQQNAGHYIQADETRIQVLKESGKTAQSDKWMWVTRGGPPDKPTVLFEYDASRAGSVINELLQDFNGILQVDGYAGYIKVCNDKMLTRVGCWDHARRKFVEASKAGHTTGKKTAKGVVSKADVAIGKIRKLYAIEKRITGLSDEEKYSVRQVSSRPVLEDLKQWLTANKPKVLKGSLTEKAISYTLNQWAYLVNYCDYGYVNISNALAENAIRPFAVGRRAWLFADTPRGAKASATCYSLIESAKANGVEPARYIEHILTHIADADSLEKIEALLPWNVS